MSKHTLEQVLEAIINKEDARASELLHQFFVAKGKQVYEELSQFDEQQEEELDETIGGSAQEDFEEEIIADEAELEDESLFGEAEEGDDPMASEEEPTEPEAVADLAMGDEPAAEEPEMGAAEGDKEGDAEEALQKADDALDELKAIFAEIMGEEPKADEEEPTEESFAALGEGVALAAVSEPSNTEGADNTHSPVSSGSKVSANGAEAVKFANEENEKGSATPAVKDMNTGNVNTVGNKKAPAPKSVAAPKNADSADNKHSPVAKA